MADVFPAPGDELFLPSRTWPYYVRLNITSIQTSPYHPHSGGLVERFNQTLKSMLRKFVTTENPNWDKDLPYLLLAYREVPQASMGFSPFDLLYGRHVRGPLDVLRESWSASSPDRHQ